MPKTKMILEEREIEPLEGTPGEIRVRLAALEATHGPGLRIVLEQVWDNTRTLLCYHRPETAVERTARLTATRTARAKARIKRELDAEFERRLALAVPSTVLAMPVTKVTSHS